MARIRTIKPDLWVNSNAAWPHGCSLYVIEEQRPGPIKVGIAEHPIRRLSTLQCGNPRQLHLRAVYSGKREDCRWVEGAILFRFAGSVLRGEWIAEPLTDILAELGDFT